MSRVGTNGRFGNHFIIDVAASLLAKKFDLSIEYHEPEYTALRILLGTELFSGSRVHETTIQITDIQYMDVYRRDTLESNITNNGWFQLGETTTLVRDFLHSDPVKASVMQTNPCRDRYQTNEDLFVHIRLGDVAHRTQTPIEYYLHAIRQVAHDTLYLASDSFNHPMVEAIRKVHPEAILLDADVLNTMWFASTCKYMVLSHGTFSACIGYLGYFTEKVYYLNEETWCPLDPFVGKGWQPVERADFEGT